MTALYFMYNHFLFVMVLNSFLYNFLVFIVVINIFNVYFTSFYVKHFCVFELFFVYEMCYINKLALPNMN